MNILKKSALKKVDEELVRVQRQISSAPPHSVITTLAENQYRLEKLKQRIEKGGNMIDVSLDDIKILYEAR